VAARPGPAPSAERDGPEANPPPNLASVPDAEPRVEPIRQGGPNKPYQVLGRDYVPLAQDRPFTERGLASWYGRKFHGRRTANGEVYDMYAMTAAHPTLPLPSYVRVRNPANNREVVLRVNDRGPFHPGRIIDLSYTAALKLGLLRGVGLVELERITFDDIRTGAWRRDRSPQPAPEPAPTEPVLAGTAAERPTPASATPSGTTTTAAAVPGGVPVAATSSDAALPATGPRTTVQAAAAVASPMAPGFWVQLGAFSRREGAEGFHRRVAADLEWLAPLLAVFNDVGKFRLQAGPYASRDEAHGAAQRVREALKLVPVVVERR
jgi:rare lipoprotein A